MSRSVSVAMRWLPTSRRRRSGPRTSWRWLNQPNTRIGATAMVEAADSLAKNSPSGLENEAMNAVSGAAPDDVRFRLQNASFQHRISDSSPVEATPGQRQRQQQVPDLAAGARAVHAAGLQDFVRHFLVEGEQHPDDDRQVHQRVDHHQPAAACRAGPAVRNSR